MKAVSSPTDSTSIAASVAPEDLRCGDCVAVLNEVVEFPSFFWCDSVLSERDELVRVRCRPSGAGMPLKIKAICLPFLFVKLPLGQCEMIDIRQVQLVRLKDPYAKTVWKGIRKQQSRRSRKTKGR